MKNKGKIFFIITCIMVCLLLIAGCTDNTQPLPAPDNPEGGSVGVATQQEVVYLGILCPGGIYARAGTQMQAAAEVGAELINNEHSLDWEPAKEMGLVDYGNATIKPIFMDCGDSAASCTEATHKLADLGVSVIIGAGTPDMTAAAALVCGKRDMPMIATHWHPGFGDGRIPVWEGFTCIDTGYHSRSMLAFKYLQQYNITMNTALKNMAVAYENTTEAAQWSEAIEEQITTAGFAQVAVIAYAKGDDDLAEEAAKMLSNAPHALLHISDAAAMEEFFASYRSNKNIGEIPIFCLSSGYQEPAMINAARIFDTGSIYGISICPPLHYRSAAETPLEITREKASELFPYLNALYRGKTGVNMNDDALLDLSAVLLAAEAVEQAGTTKADMLEDTLRQTVFDAPWLFSGSIDFEDNTGINIIEPAYVSSIREGSYVYVY